MTYFVDTLRTFPRVALSLYSTKQLIMCLHVVVRLMIDIQELAFDYSRNEI